jgi:hypothetical protein
MLPGVEALEEDDTSVLGTCRTKSGGMRDMLLSTMLAALGQCEMSWAMEVLYVMGGVRSNRRVRVIG